MTASQRAKHSEFKPVAAWVRDIQQQLEERACRVAAEHVARMAELPEGTCEYCYGTGKRDGEMCGRCNELELYAPGVPYEFHTATLGNYREDSGNKSALAKAKGFLVGTSDLYLTARRDLRAPSPMTRTRGASTFDSFACRRCFISSNQDAIRTKSQSSSGNYSRRAFSFWTTSAQSAIKHPTTRGEPC